MKEVKQKRISKGAAKRAEKEKIYTELRQKVEHHRSTKKDNPVITNRMERRSGLQQGSEEAMKAWREKGGLNGIMKGGDEDGG